MKPIILFRNIIDTNDELTVASQFFDIVFLRTEVLNNAFVIPRYSALPFYDELEKDIVNLGGILINTYEQHRWIANFDYYELLSEFTPQTWFDSEFNDDGPFVVKGRTNSRKHDWGKKMFAKNKEEAIEIGCELLRDNLIGQQGIIYRKYIPLRTYEIGINGLPFTNEWRFFYLGKKCLSYSYYWSIAQKTDWEIPQIAIDFANFIANKVHSFVNFFVLDIAETETGEWILIEINDATMSGLSLNDPNILYKNLRDEICVYL